MDIAINRVSAEGTVIADKAEAAIKVTPTGSTHEQKKKARESEESRSAGTQNTQELTRHIQQYLDRMNVKISFSTYGESGQRVAVTVMERETGKVIREIPSEELQQLYSKMEELVGMIFNEKV